MSAALLHYSQPDLPPVGVWWLPKHRSQPKSYYPNSNSSFYVDGARAVLGGDYDGEMVTLAQWQTLSDRLSRTANPFAHFLAVDPGDKSPQSLLTTDPKDLKAVTPS